VEAAGHSQLLVLWKHVQLYLPVLWVTLVNNNSLIVAHLMEITVVMEVCQTLLSNMLLIMESPMKVTIPTELLINLAKQKMAKFKISKFTDVPSGDCDALKNAVAQ